MLSRRQLQGFVGPSPKLNVLSSYVFILKLDSIYKIEHLLRKRRINNDLSLERVVGPIQLQISMPFSLRHFFGGCFGVEGPLFPHPFESQPCTVGGPTPAPPLLGSSFSFAFSFAFSWVCSFLSFVVDPPSEPYDTGAAIDITTTSNVVINFMSDLLWSFVSGLTVKVDATARIQSSSAGRIRDEILLMWLSH
jgi:hypothetical protein